MYASQCYSLPAGHILQYVHIELSYKTMRITWPLYWQSERGLALIESVWNMLAILKIGVMKTQKVVKQKTPCMLRTVYFSIAHIQAHLVAFVSTCFNCNLHDVPHDLTLPTLETHLYIVQLHSSQYCMYALFTLPFFPLCSFMSKHTYYSLTTNIMYW